MRETAAHLLVGKTEVLAVREPVARSKVLHVFGTFRDGTQELATISQVIEPKEGAPCQAGEVLDAPKAPLVLYSE